MRLAYEGPLAQMPPEIRQRLLDRRSSFEPFVEAVRPIRDAVRERGDEALVQLTEKFDGWRATSFEIHKTEQREALRSLPANIQSALEKAHANIRKFHESQLRTPADVEVAPGIRAGRRMVPYARVGAYVPGGRAAYPSTVLMTVTVAKVAGVREVVVCTPAGRDGKVPAATLAACAVAGADRVFAIGGAQAVFAMAYGTASIPRCDKVVGPGNAYVAAAKSLVAGDVSIDSPAGPSEVLILHTATSDARFAAAEMAAQAEHDPDAACVLVTTDANFAEATRDALRSWGRDDVVEAALAKRGAIVVAASEDEAVAFSEAFAPEHLVVYAPNPRGLLHRMTNYGSAFLGPWSTVALGDYASGPNHVLPTAGLARSYSGLSVDDFQRRPTHQEATPEGLHALAPVVEALAELEGLPNHAAAVRVRRTGL